MENNSIKSMKRTKNKIGVIVFLILTALTVFEFIIAVSSTRLTALLILFALTKASLIIVYFMHIRKLFSGSEE